jgi:hypothetical protein
MALEERAKPDIAAPTDAIVRITKTTICAPIFTSSRAMWRAASQAASWVMKA